LKKFRKMKRTFNIIVAFATLLLSSCIKQIEKTFTGAPVAEIDAAVLNSVASGVSYPILNRIPAGGRPVVTTVDSTLRRWAGTVRVRVNLVGPQSKQERTVGYRIFESPVTTFAFPATLTASQAPPSGQTPAQPSATLNISNAVAGTHYTALSGIATVPADSSFAYINVNVLNNGSAAGQGRFLGITLDSSGTILPSLNYRSLGLVIDQR
jgi:hypothetical protein